jgi:hypothetical protein
VWFCSVGRTTDAGDGKRMSNWYGVDSGDVVRSVESDTHMGAAVKATVEHIKEHGRASPGEIYRVIRVGDDEDHTLFMLSELVRSEGGFIVKTDPPNEGEPKI